MARSRGSGGLGLVRRLREGDPGRRARGPAPPDPYEFAASRLEAQRASRSMGTDTGPPGSDVVPSPTRRARLLLVVVGVLVLVAVGQTAARDHGGAALHTSCTTPALRLGSGSVHQDSPTSYTAVGPPDLTVVLAVGASSLRRGADGHVVPLPARGAAGMQLASPARRLAGCRTSGRFGIQVPPGSYTVTLFALTSGGGSRPLVTAPLTVTSPRNA